MGRFGGAPWALLGLIWELLGSFWVRFWVRWGSLKMLFGCFSGFGGRANTKTTNLDFDDLLTRFAEFKGPKASNMRSKLPLRREKRERRKCIAEKREKRAP